MNYIYRSPFLHLYKARICGTFCAVGQNQALTSSTPPLALDGWLIPRLCGGDIPFFFFFGAKINPRRYKKLEGKKKEKKMDSARDILATFPL